MRSRTLPVWRSPADMHRGCRAQCGLAIRLGAAVEVGGAPRIELIGELTAMLRAADVVVPGLAGGMGMLGA